MRQGIRCQPVGPCHLRYHLVGSAAEIEPVDVILADKQCKRIADRLHGQPEFVDFGAVYLDLDCRLVEVQIAVGDDEQPAFSRLRFDLVHRQIDVLVAAGRVNHHLHRQPADRPGQWRQ